VCLGGPELHALYDCAQVLGRSQLRNEPLASSVLAVEADVPGIAGSGARRFERPVRTSSVEAVEACH
jgi:hypothetical protein